MVTNANQTRLKIFVMIKRSDMFGCDALIL